MLNEKLFSMDRMSIINQTVKASYFSKFQNHDEHILYCHEEKAMNRLSATHKD